MLKQTLAALSDQYGISLDAVYVKTFINLTQICTVTEVSVQSGTYLKVEMATGTILDIPPNHVQDFQKLI